MTVDVVKVRPLGGHKLEVEFSDGSVGVRDFAAISQKTGSMAEPLKDPSYFARVFVDDGVLTWPNGYDWDTMALYEDMKNAKLLRRIEAAE